MGREAHGVKSGAKYFWLPGWIRAGLSPRNKSHPRCSPNLIRGIAATLLKVVSANRHLTLRRIHVKARRARPAMPGASQTRVSDQLSNLPSRGQGRGPSRRSCCKSKLARVPTRTSVPATGGDCRTTTGGGIDRGGLRRSRTVPTPSPADQIATSASLLSKPRISGTSRLVGSSMPMENPPGNALITCTLTPVSDVNICQLRARLSSEA
jgi:hypothetical protein